MLCYLEIVLTKKYKTVRLLYFCLPPSMFSFVPQGPSWFDSSPFCIIFGAIYPNFKKSKQRLDNAMTKYTPLP